MVANGKSGTQDPKVGPRSHDPKKVESIRWEQFLNFLRIAKYINSKRNP